MRLVWTCSRLRQRQPHSGGSFQTSVAFVFGSCRPTLEQTDVIYCCQHLSLLSSAEPSLLRRHTHTSRSNAILLSSSIIPPLLLHLLPLHHCLPQLLCHVLGIPIPHPPSAVPLFHRSLPNSAHYLATRLLILLFPRDKCAQHSIRHILNVCLSITSRPPHSGCFRTDGFNPNQTIKEIPSG